MRRIETTPVFDRAMKKIRKYSNFKKQKFDTAIEKLCNGEKLDPIYKDHKAVEHSRRGYNKSRIFHAAPDIVVIYMLTDDALILQDIGSHSDLFEDLM